MTTGDNMKGHLYGLIETIGKAERVTKKSLSIFSRDALSYVVDTQDIAVINRLLGNLTPQNYKIAVLFFSHFLPWQTESDKAGNFLRFGKKLQSDKKISAKEKLITDFLLVEENDIWSWADENTTTEVKKKDFGGMISRLVTQALKGDEKSDTDPLKATDIINHVFRAGVSLDDMLLACAEEENRIKLELEAAAIVQPEVEPNH